ncbi:MAG: threonine--tRNA ligase [Oligoflexia bacterium]|nr:threonine--tRNA ligase [Oligoflexia bacterium]
MPKIRVTLPDQSVKEFASPITIAELAAAIGPGLAKSAIAGKIDGEVVDIRTLISKDSHVTIITTKDREALDVVRHSAAHILAQAVQKLWPEVKITIGPVIDTGFFYDLDSPRTFVPEDLDLLEKEMHKITAADYEIKRTTMPVDEAIATFKKMGERFKVEIIEDLKKQGEKEVSIYHQGDWFDLCRGPHVPKTSFVKAFKLLSIAGAYWRGDEKNPQLQRIYGTAFPSKKELDDYLLQLEEAKKRDHRRLGKDLGLFMFHPWAPASPFFLPKGTAIYNELLKYLRELYFEYGYEEVVTPQVLDTETFKTSGHYDNYRENMYFAVPADAEVKEERSAMVKAMNCPCHALIFGSSLRSYRDLPWRVADFGRLHRFERAGVVHGLARVRTFCQDDAHIFCTIDQIQAEIVSFMSLLKEVYERFGFSEFSVFFSTRPPKRLGDDSLWDKAEHALESALKSLHLPYQMNTGDGAFYGPKLDIMVTDAIGRKWQLGTIQCDFNMANRFNLEYTGEDNKPHKPVVLHRAVLGSFERFIGVYIEHCGGVFPSWIAPVQAVLINITQSQEEYLKILEAKLKAHGVRVESDFRNEKLGFKIREAQLQKVPYMIIAGDNEVAEGTVSVRLKSGKEIKGIKVDEFVNKLVEEIRSREVTGPWSHV